MSTIYKSLPPISREESSSYLDNSLSGEDTFQITLELSSHDLFSIHQNPYLASYNSQHAPRSAGFAILHKIEKLPGFVTFSFDTLDKDTDVFYLEFQRNPYGKFFAKFDEIHASLRIGKIFHQTFPESLSEEQEKELDVVLAHFDKVKEEEVSSSHGQFIPLETFNSIKETVNAMELAISLVASETSEVEEDDDVSSDMEAVAPKMRNPLFARLVEDVKPSSSTDSMVDSGYGGSGKTSEIPSRTESPFERADSSFDVFEGEEPKE